MMVHVPIKSTTSRLFDLRLALDLAAATAKANVSDHLARQTSAEGKSSYLKLSPSLKLYFQVMYLQSWHLKN